MSLVAIGKFAEMTGVPFHVLRRLHAREVLMPAHIDNNGRRYYNEDQIPDAQIFVKKMKLLVNGENIIDASEHLEPFFAYLLGLILADGTVCADGQVQLEMKDRQILDDVSAILGAIVHPRSDRPMYRITVPRPVARRLVEYGACRRKSHGFIIPHMDECSFGHFLRGLFDGDGSASIRYGRRILRIHGHPKAMAYIQATLLGHYELYLPWVPDNRIESGMLETGRKSTIDDICDMMYGAGGVCLNRKKETLTTKKEISHGNGIDVVPSHPA